jgi:PEP-CTERM motif
MTVPRSRIREGFLAGAAYTLVAYGLAGCALLLVLFLSRADAKPATYANSTNPFIDPVALAAIPEPALLGLLGTGLLSTYLALRHRRRLPDSRVHQIDERRLTSRAENMA